MKIYPVMKIINLRPGQSHSLPKHNPVPVSSTFVPRSSTHATSRCRNNMAVYPAKPQSDVQTSYLQPVLVLCCRLLWSVLTPARMSRGDFLLSVLWSSLVLRHWATSNKAELMAKLMAELMAKLMAELMSKLMAELPLSRLGKLYCLLICETSTLAD